MRLEGLGQSTSITALNAPQCGDNPCTWFDNVWVSDACLNYLQCAQPGNILVTAMNQGTGAAAGQAVGQVATGVVGGAATGIGNTVGTNGALIIAAAAMLALLIVLKK